MTYAPHYRLTFGGVLGLATAPVEEWSNTLNFVTTSSLLPNTQDAVDAMWTTLTGLITDSAMSMSTCTNLTFAKLALVDATGHVPGTVYRHDGLATGPEGSGTLPFQDSLAVSLVTGLRGPSHRGRFYLPPQKLPISPSSGLIGSDQRDAIEAKTVQILRALIGNLTTAGGASGADLVVASSKGYNTHVLGVKVGRVVDTQRRRRRSLPESYGDATPM